MNEPKRIKLNGGRANPPETSGQRVRSTRPLGSRLVLSALKCWELRQGKKPYPFNSYYEPEKGET